MAPSSPCSADFARAACRNWQDAELLERAGRIDNADQLLGLAAECALKMALLLQGVQPDEKKAGAPTGHAVHINRLWGLYSVFQQNRAGQFATIPAHNPFHDFDISQRYCVDVVTGNGLKAHKGGVMSCFELLDFLVMERT